MQHPAALRGAPQARTSAFTLVEVTLSVGVLAVALVSLMGLLPVGLANFRQAMTNTIESQIVQSISNEVLQTKFGNLDALSKQEYVYGNDGKPLEKAPTAAEPAIYTAHVSLRPLDNLDAYPVKMQSGGARNEAYNVFIEITNATAPNQKTTYSVIVADNNI